MTRSGFFRVFGLSAITLMVSLTLAAQMGDPNDLLLKKLNEQFVPTVFNQDESDVVTAGTVVTLQKDDLLVFRRPVKYCPISTYKNGKLSQGFGDKSDVTSGDNLDGIRGFMDFPQKILGFGDKFWIDGFGIANKNNAILAIVVTDPNDDGRYCGMLKFPYEKGHPPTPDEAVRMISEVLAPQLAQDKSAPDRGGQLVPGQGNDPIKAIQQRLRDTIALASLDDNGDIATAGSVITLQRGSLQMCATPNSGAPPDAGAPANTYKNGKLSAGMFTWRLGLGISKIDPNTIAMRTYVAGEKFWVVNYKVKENGIQFKLWTDPDSNNIRYWSWLEIPFDKKQIPSADEVMKTVAEVLTVDNQGLQQAAEPAAVATPTPAQDGPPPIAGEYTATSGSRILLLTDGSFTKFVGGGQGHGQYVVDGDNLTLTFTSTGFSQHFKIQRGNLLDVNTQQGWARTGDAPATPTAYQELAPPPPPPAPAPTISIGQTKAQVTAGFGEPQRKATAGPKEIFFYTELKMKVTFTNGKVSSVE